MFNGSEHFNDDHFKAMERVGATDLNGTTSEDRTNYFENVPTTRSIRRCGWSRIAWAICSARLTRPSSTSNAAWCRTKSARAKTSPTAASGNCIVTGTYPAGHPYSWTVIGSMEDLNAASLDDVKEWFRTYYGAANAVLVLAGDIDAETAREKVEQYFGDIPSGPPVAAPGSVDRQAARRAARR